MYCTRAASKRATAAAARTRGRPTAESSGVITRRRCPKSFNTSPRLARFNHIGQVISITEWRAGRPSSASLPQQPQAGREAFRPGGAGHRAIENSLHWVWDVTFREDESRTRDRRLAENLAALRLFAIGLFRPHPSKHSLRSKQRIASWNPDFLSEAPSLQTT